ncbi:hypothetical protein AB6735_22185 [Mucilaginibacter sp. RCC_168]|uniref:hypothetical protein n=1 Tax=Mucilaginibacter sp. RCC_168 TaxID=3239221 RepID=UPI003526046E
MSKLKIIDLEGKEIAVTDLSLAILQADDYRHYRHVDPEYADFDEKKRRYWEDVYQKLIRLKNE